MRLTKMRVVTAAGVLALAGGVAALTGAGAAAAARPATPAHAQAEVSSPHPGDLYFVSASGEYIMRLPLAGGKPQRVVKVGEVSVTGIAISGNRLFWVTQDGESGSLDYVTLNGAAVAHTLVWHLSFSTGLVAADGWLYWADQNAIGRVRPNGAQLTRRFVVPPQEFGGGIAEGLATDGKHLFFSRCQNNEIARVGTSGHSLDLSFIKLPAESCPQGLAVGNDYIYWSELASHVGRATLQGTGASGTWLNIRSSQGPFYLAADGSNVYWDWGGGAGSPTHVGTARVNRAGLNTSILLGQGAFLLTSPGANS
jgi:hypothetical protein